MAISATLPTLRYRKAMENIYTNVAALETATAGLDAAELGVLNGVTAGTVTASKAVVVDSNKDVGDFRNVDVVNLDAGASGTVGTVDIFPATAASGKTQITAANNAGDTTTTITNASQAGARTYTIPDAGSSASFVMTEGAQTINGTKTFGGSIVRAGRQKIIPICGNAKVGATAGWVITAGTDRCHATLPASQTSSTLVIPIDFLHVGDTLTAVNLHGQVESAGNNVTLTLAVRKSTEAAADITDAEIGTDTNAALTADTALDGTQFNVTGLTEVMAATEMVYVLITATTAASTDIDLTHLVVTYSEV